MKGLNVPISWYQITSLTFTSTNISTTKKQKGGKNGKISQETLKKQLKLKLQQQHESEWKADTGSSSKLNFNGEIKEKYTFEKYSRTFIVDRSWRQIFSDILN